MEGDPADDRTLFPATAGERLRAAREAQGVDLAEIAARTRIPQRHLEAIEQANYRGLPSITYAMGFAKSYARAVGVDEVAIGRQVRAEIGDAPERPSPTPSYEMTDPTRVPPSGLAWFGVVVALLVSIGVGLWYGTDWFRGGAPVESVAIPEASQAAPGNATAPAAAPTAPVATGGQVTLVANDSVWVRVSDGSGKRLYEKEMAAGERYDVPAGADRPHARTGRPEKLQVLINGSQAAPLGAPASTVDVEVTAAALQARAATAPASAGNTTATP
ncbi:helix-turn-helix domain-containing protein [Sphingomonas sp. MMS12-HWE2-04]|uniref:helix-turn-helix domain-containing protein n=1 Tax=Sphingomonas sp. MMS12-HWE2-04 TaxID=3234199 RepID=UPI00384EB007